MSAKAIEVSNIGKCYRLAGKEPYLTLRDAMDRVVRAPYQMLRGKKNASGEGTLFWSLDDVSFDVKRGEILSIIGHNGSGKSTLLKILAGITEPSRGHADVYGRVAALLEVGTGFHSELSGRENVYLNGAILGMKRAEIGAKFDEIVEFAEIAKFIDEPVKYYSSGMFLRLGFSVAAHLDPSILLVDEVLSVGDLAFQTKCQRKIESFVNQGRTVIVVSHDLDIVQRISHRALLLSGGKMVTLGDPAETVARYREIAVTN